MMLIKTLPYIGLVIKVNSVTGTLDYIVILSEAAYYM